MSDICLYIFKHSSVIRQLPVQILYIFLKITNLYTAIYVSFNDLVLFKCCENKRH